MRRQNHSTKTMDRELVITRVFNAPRQAVWDAWTQPEKVKRWWGPRGYSAPFVKIDLRVGGEYLFAMRGPDGKDNWSKGVYREIVPPERLVVTDSFADEHGNIVPASYYGLSADFALESLVTVTFEELPGDRTRMTLHYHGVPATDHDSAVAGWNQTLDKLAELLAAPEKRTRVDAEPGKQEFFITREFEAPREMVFSAYVEPELYAQWIGPRKYKINLEKSEPWSGGSWRYTHTDKEGNSFAFHGVYHEVLPPSRLIDTFEFEGLPETGHVSLETATFEELPAGRTRMVEHSVFQSVADRDGMIGSGMEEGIRESFERLDELLEKLKKGNKE